MTVLRAHPVAVFALVLTVFVLVFASNEQLAQLVVVVGAPLSWLVTLRLWSLSRAEPHVRSLRERAIASTAWSIIVTVFAAIFVNNSLPIPFLNPAQTMYVTRSTLLIGCVVSSISWLRLTRR